MKNILFLMADEFRYNVAGFMGNKVSHTPHLDRLAAGAAVFDNAYTASPICVPGRQCLATGKYPLHIGCEEFGADIAPGSQTFARQFTDHGYYTVACGKLHHRGPDQMQGWMHRIGAETAVRWPEIQAERNQIGRSKWRGVPDLKEAGAGLSPLSLHDDYSVRGARDFLRMHFGGMYAIPPETPVLLMLSLQQPHFPLLSEPGLLEKYQDRVPIFWHQAPSGNPLLDKGRLAEEEGITEADVRRATAAYYGMVERTDQRIGEILSAMEEVGQNPDEWIIIFTSDHGELLGEHSLWGKRKFYEGSARVPLFVRAPGLPVNRFPQVCNTVDVFPTLLDLAGLPPVAGLDGTSLFATQRPAETYCQYGRGQFMLRRGALKYLHLDDVSDVLFDLDADPRETRNLIADPAYSTVAADLLDRVKEFASTACETTAAR